MHARTHTHIHAHTDTGARQHTTACNIWDLPRILFVWSGFGGLEKHFTKCSLSRINVSVDVIARRSFLCWFSRFGTSSISLRNLSMFVPDAIICWNILPLYLNTPSWTKKYRMLSTSTLNSCTKSTSRLVIFFSSENCSLVAMAIAVQPAAVAVV